MTARVVTLVPGLEPAPPATPACVMILPFALVLSQLAVQPHRVRPVLAFPERGLDDSVSYQQYETRLFRDAAGNTVQIYREGSAGRVVHVLADADDESIGFSARDARGAPARLRWNGEDAGVWRRGRTRVLEYALTSPAPTLRVGHFLLGSMRVERDFQYAGRQRAPFTGAAFPITEVERMVSAIDRLPAAEQRGALAHLGAESMAVLRARLVPVVTVDARPRPAVRVVQPSIDGRDTLTLEIIVQGRGAQAVLMGDAVELRGRPDAPLALGVRITTTARALTPLTRAEIFRPEFLAFLAGTQRAAAGQAPDSPVALRARRLERQARGVELLVSREKLMAGLPTYATYFGRDMLVSALMMHDVWRPAMSEAAITSALWKLGPAGDVSHEEAVGGQAVRENAAIYATLADSAAASRARGAAAEGDAIGRRADGVLEHLRTPRENYHMIDDEFQLPIVVSRWLDDASVSASHKRAFLLDSSDGGGTRLVRLVRELALVGRLTTPYAARADATNLISFPARDTGWASASWRDSGAGYAGGRYAMDVNTIWAPHALEATARIMTALARLGLQPAVAMARAGIGRDEPLATWSREPERLRAATAAWNGAARHFVVSLGGAEVTSRIGARLDAMPAAERAYWRTSLAQTGADHDSLSFLALSLDAAGRPIAVANTDPATRLFLGEHEGTAPRPEQAERERVLRDVRLFVRPYPAGLRVEGVGPATANDAYAPPAIWRMFEKDPYHGPRVVWGREVNLFLLGVANRLAQSRTEPPAADAGRAAYDGELRAAVRSVRGAVEASGFHGELWSYGVAGGRLLPMRYGTAGDVQLWSTTELAVEYALSRVTH